MISNFRTHLSHPKQTGVIHWERISAQRPSLVAFVVAGRRHEISSRERKEAEVAGQKLPRPGGKRNR